MWPEPGIYKDIPVAQYHALDAVSQSLLKRCQRSLAHGHAPQKPPTPDMEFGTLCHSYILTPEDMLDQYVVAPRCDRRTKEGKATFADFQASAAGRQIVDADDLAAAKAMREAVHAHPAAAEMLAVTRRELSCVWIDCDTGLPCKARVDLDGEDWLGDLKTTRDASPRWFPGECAKYGYHIQGAWYHRAIRCDEFRIIAVEKEPPHAVSVYRLSAESLAIGYELGERLLREYADAKRLDIWPAYPDEIQTLELPAWAKNELPEIEVIW